MHKVTRHILLVIALTASFFCHAQIDEETDTVITEVIAPPASEELIEEPSWMDESYGMKATPVEVRQLPKGKVEELKKDDAYWYANIEPEKKKPVEAKQDQRNKSLFDAGWFQNLLWIIILFSFIGVVIWYLASSNIRLFRKEPKKIIDEGVEEEMTDDIFAINYDREIHKAVAAQNYRLAVRLWYLKTLKELSDRNMIDYRHGKTNSDYVNSLFGGRYYRDFFRLKRNFEYTWYGQFNLSPEAYEMMRADFTNFENSLS